VHFFPARIFLHSSFQSYKGLEKLETGEMKPGFEALFSPVLSSCSPVALRGSLKGNFIIIEGSAIWLWLGWRRTSRDDKFTFF
jgi:hypothetical protein